MAKSAALFGRGLLRHFLYWVPGVFLGVLELVQRETGKPVDMPVWVFWLVFGIGVLAAAFLAFHDLRKETAPELLRDVRRGIGAEIGEIINEGEALSELGLGFSELSKMAADWWNSAGVFIETVLGPAERHIVSEPQSAPHYEDLIEAHCNLLRGSLQRLPDADLRVDYEGLLGAIGTRRQAMNQPRDE